MDLNHQKNVNVHQYIMQAKYVLFLYLRPLNYTYIHILYPDLFILYNRRDEKDNGDEERKGSIEINRRRR